MRQKIYMHVKKYLIINCVLGHEVNKQGDKEARGPCFREGTQGRPLKERMSVPRAEG